MSKAWIRFTITANGTVGFASMILYAHTGDRLSMVFGVLNVAGALFSLSYAVTKAAPQ